MQADRQHEAFQDSGAVLREIGMFAFKVVATTITVLLMAILLLCVRGEQDKDAKLGIGALCAVYLLNLIAIWG